jgi:hypothetical protein
VLLGHAGVEEVAERLAHQIAQQCVAGAAFGQGEAGQRDRHAGHGVCRMGRLHANEVADEPPDSRPNRARRVGEVRTHSQRLDCASRRDAFLVGGLALDVAFGHLDGGTQAVIPEQIPHQSTTADGEQQQFALARLRPCPLGHWLSDQPLRVARLGQPLLFGHCASSDPVRSLLTI